jgi:hypothetical protein
LENTPCFYPANSTFARIFISVVPGKQRYEVIELRRPGSTRPQLNFASVTPRLEIVLYGRTTCGSGLHYVKGTAGLWVLLNKLVVR